MGVQLPLKELILRDPFLTWCRGHCPPCIGGRRSRLVPLSLSSCISIHILAPGPSRFLVRRPPPVVGGRSSMAVPGPSMAVPARFFSSRSPFSGFWGQFFSFQAPSSSFQPPFPSFWVAVSVFQSPFSHFWCHFCYRFP